MFNIFKKDKVIFSCIDKKFLNFYPPIYSKDLNRNFIKKCNEEYKKNIENLKNPMCPFVKVSNTAKCPGILDIINAGYIFKMHRDIRITTNGNLVDFKWESIGRKINENTECVSYFTTPQFSDHIQIPPNSLKTLIKINLPWIISSSDYCFLQMQPSFIEDYRFTVVQGIINPKKAREVNIVLYWHVLNGSEILTAGTPICQLIPIQKKLLPKMIINENSNTYLKDIENFNFKRFITNNNIEKNF
jgi:hypothetical protein